MIINNTNVRGIWSYSDNLVFEKGDFVVSGDQIYICKGTGVQGIKPTNKDYFTEYPGNMVRSVEEYYNIINDDDISDDLYISSRVLNEILQDTYFGLGDNGIITSSIESDGTLHGQISKKLGSSEHVLDDLLVSPDFNNGVVLVSRNFSDIKNLVGLLSFGSSEANIRNIVKIDPLKCIGCGNCMSICPQGAIEITGEEEVYECPVCGHIYTQEEAIEYDTWVNNPVRMGNHWKCPNSMCGFNEPKKKAIYNYKINTSTCDLCGKCFDSCRVDAIYVTQEDSVTSESTVDSSENQTFSTMISGFRVQDLEYVFVRQYSYKSALNGYLNRIQELVDPDQGLMFFRHAVRRGETIDTTEWKSCLSRDAILIGRELNRIRERLSKEESVATTSGFRYRSIDLEPRNNDSYFISNSSLPAPVNGVKRIVTFVVELQGGLVSSYNTSIDLSTPSDYDGAGKTYYINDDISFVVTRSTGGFDIVFAVDPSNEVLVVRDVYCREAC